MHRLRALRHAVHLRRPFPERGRLQENGRPRLYEMPPLPGLHPETGKNPVSGGGYGGPFSGEGFDRFWTDMSEIVRPTRDGIHAREYISTVVDIGRKPKDLGDLTFDEYGNPLTNIPPSMEINLPILFNLTTVPFRSEKVELAVARTAAALRTLAIIDRDRMTPALEAYSSSLIESFSPDTMPWKELASVARTSQAIELRHGEEISKLPQSLKAINPDLVVMVRVEDPPEVEGAVRLLYEAGADVIHLRSRDNLGDVVRKAHLALVSDRVRDEITIIASGGVAEAAHVPKSIIMGADAVAIDLPLLLALECIYCPGCGEPGACPRHLDAVAPGWGSSRIINLMASWHNQLLEMMGAMGLREVSRLRGEVGRAIFYDDMERELQSDFKRAYTEKPL